MLDQVGMLQSITGIYDYGTNTLLKTCAATCRRSSVPPRPKSKS
jgi:hypothetical protein